MEKQTGFDEDDNKKLAAYVSTTEPNSLPSTSKINRTGSRKQNTFKSLSFQTKAARKKGPLLVGREQQQVNNIQDDDCENDTDAVSFVINTKQNENVSDEEDENHVTQMDSEYVQKPTSAFFVENHLEKIYADFTTGTPDLMWIYKPEHLLQKNLKFKTKPVIRTNYVQFLYKQCPTLILTTNMYGFCISNSEDFSDKTVVQNMLALENKHRVAFLLPTVNYWWNKNSAATFKAFIDRFAVDVKTFATNNDFVTAMTRFGLNNDVLVNFKHKHLSATKSVSGCTVPALFGIKVFNTNSLPSRIDLSLVKVADGLTLVKGKPKELLPSSYMHAVLVMNVNGFKITRAGISLDTEAKYVIYNKFERKERSHGPVISLPTFFPSSAGKRSCDDSSSDEENPQSQPTASVKKMQKMAAFELL